ncbi:spermidine/putrescine ABC transporter permease [Mesoplasma coleopterae]|uniref:Spermidine/putrescine ABC transporter permease n=1 Tax=Mesoplasma coleopterae TaxID=324078 RepID=A0A2K8P2Q6_9MOLU|nr:spermidine/putrescine ABC transporter permease [Mesoplasma coleopterae]ATZ21044.1 spermidine/putrescine ABC transporter permease [Mesoplasma coleopterae]
MKKVSKAVEAENIVNVNLNEYSLNKTKEVSLSENKSIFKKVIKSKSKQKEGFDQEQLETAIDNEIARENKQRIRQKIKEINKTLGRTKLFNFGKGKAWPILLPFFVVMICLVIVPIISIIVYSVVQPSGDMKMFEFSLKNFIRIFSTGGIMRTIGLTIAYAFLAALMCIIFGYPIALIMSEMRSKILAKNMWLLVTMPMWISMLLKVLGLRSLFLIMAPSALGTQLAIIIGMTYMFLPFAITPIYDSLESRRIDIEEAAMDLGCSKFRTFWTVTFRSSMPGVITALTLVLLQAATSLVVVQYMGDGKITLITSIIESYFFKGSDFGFGAAISVVLAVFVFLLMVVSKFISNKFEKKGANSWKDSSDQLTLL